MISRRAFLGLATAAPLFPAAAEGDAAPCSTAPLSAVPVRACGKVEIAFKSPGPQPNGLQATREGLWIIDQSAGSKAWLVDYADGRVIRSFDTDTVRPSGITFDGEALWIGSTFSYENVRCSAETGAVLERRPTPGSTNYTMVGDPSNRPSPLAGSPLAQRRPPAVPAAAAPPAATAPSQPLRRLTQTPSTQLQGAHGQESRDGKLWTTSTSARTIYCLDAKTWVVEKRLQAPGNRPHGLAWEGRYLWHGDSNLAAFFKFDVDSGAIVEKIQLTDADPVAHGLTIWDGTLWYCDDIGVVCKMKI
jgi:outer membrane protein assembly factor BamB